MPREFPYRFLLVKALETLIAPEVDISNLKLSCDADGYVVFDRPTADLKYRNVSEFGTFEEIIETAAQDDDVVLSTFSNIVQASISGGTNLYIYGIGVITAEQIAVAAYGQT